MSDIITSKKKAYGFFVLFTLTYMVSYITRINFGAVILEMVQSTGMSQSSLSLALMGSSITYGAGQIVSGVLGDKFRPKILMFIGLTLSSVMNLIIPFCTSSILMTVVWCINGFAQSFMWPPLVRLMTALFTADDFKKCSVYVSWGSSFGTILIYLITPLFITLSGWKTLFWFSSACGMVMATFWMVFCKDISPAQKNTESLPSQGKKLGFISPLFILIMFSIVMQGALRDGITTWMPTYISNTYHLSSSISILTGVILPLFSILSFQVASLVYRKKLKNPLTCALLFFAVGSVSALCLYFLSDVNVVISIALSALLTGCMHGVNLMLITMVPAYYKDKGNVSTVSGVLNSCTYVGSALSIYGIALLSETKGWSVTLLVWFGITLLGCILLAVASPLWKKKF